MPFLVDEVYIILVLKVRTKICYLIGSYPKIDPQLGIVNDKNSKREGVF